MSLKDITIGRYIHGASIVHRLDPRTKLFSLLAVTAVLFSRDGWTTVGIAGAYALMACLLSGLRPLYIARSLLPFKWLILVTVLLNVLFVGGHILVEAPLPYGGITREGLETGGLYGGRIALLVLLASLLTLTTEPIVLVDGIEKLLKPLSGIGIKPHDVSLSMVVTIRFIPILLDEAEKIRKSHVARGLRPDRNVAAKLKSLSILFLPLFHSTLRRAENLAVAMDCRLYQSGLPRTRYIESTLTGIDWAVMTATVLLVAAATAL